MKQIDDYVYNIYNSNRKKINVRLNFNFNDESQKYYETRLGDFYADRYIMLINFARLTDRIKDINEQIKKHVVNTYHLNFINAYGIYIPEKRIDDVVLASNMARIALNEAKHNYLMTPIVYYQANRDIINDVWNSSKALVRWKDDNGQIIPPYKFIPLFEKNVL